MAPTGVRILASPLPIMSPAWSPDGEWLAYVVRRRVAIFVQHVVPEKRPWSRAPP
jgi:Tol biopolymer transport system component